MPKTVQDLIDDCEKANRALDELRADFSAASKNAKDALQRLCNALILVGPIYSSANESVYSVNSLCGTKELVVTKTHIATAIEYKPDEPEQEKVPA